MTLYPTTAPMTTEGIRGTAFPASFHPTEDRRKFLGSEGGETGVSYYLYTDGLGMTELIGKQWGKWYRYDASAIATEQERIARMYAGMVREQEAAGQRLCVYEFMIDRQGAAECLRDAITVAFPDVVLVPTGEVL